MLGFGLEGDSAMATSGTTARPAGEAKGPLSAEELRLIDAYWRAANFLSVGQIYLLDNALLREPLAVEHALPRAFNTGDPAALARANEALGARARARFLATGKLPDDWRTNPVFVEPLLAWHEAACAELES